MPPLCTQRWGHIALPLSAQSVSVCVCLPFISLQCFLYCRRSNTRRWPNVWLMLAHRLQYWVTVSCLATHWMWASITDGGPTLTQLWFKASCWYRQHEVLTRAEWILPSTGDAGPTFNRHCIGVSLYSVDTPPPTEITVQCWMVDGQSQQGGPGLSRHWVDVSCLLGIVW